MRYNGPKPNANSEVTKRFNVVEKEETVPEDIEIEDPKLIKYKIRGFIRSFDIYGQSVTFNANKEGDTINTTFGGLISIQIYFFMAFYITYLF